MLQPEAIESLNKVVKQPGASEEGLEQLQAILGTRLPVDYLDLLRFCNGADGEMGEQFWFILWPAEQVPKWNIDRAVEKFAPGLVLIASDGGGTLFGIDARANDPAKMEYVQFDAIVLNWGAEEFRCKTMAEFLEHLATA